MKILAHNFVVENRRHERGILLADCIVYIAMFFVVIGLAFSVFYSCWDNARAFRRVTDQIATAMKTGERWREDVRSATGPLREENSAAGEVLHIPSGTGAVDYRFAEGALWRRTDAQAEWMEILPKVKSSHMAADPRAHVTAWRWEMELQTRRTAAHVVPLFTFEAVPQPHE